MIVYIEDPADDRLEAFANIRERDLVGRAGKFVAEGKIVLSILLDTPNYEVESVLLLDLRISANADLLAKIPEQVPVFVVRQEVMDAITGFSVHRGILAIGKRRSAPTMAELVANPPEDCLIVVLSAISNHDNVGSIFRNAAAFSAHAVLLDGLCCDPLYRKALRVSVGGVLTVPWVKGGSVDDIVEALIGQGFKVAALSPSGKLTIGALPKTGRRALLLGSEGHGLPASLLNRLQTYKIPMSEQFDSLNVATASGIALFASSCFSQ